MKAAALALTLAVSGCSYLSDEEEKKLRDRILNGAVAVATDVVTDIIDDDVHAGEGKY